jgi:hypothetical protein
VRSTACHVPFNSGGKSEIDNIVASITAANSFLFSVRAGVYSFIHQPEPSQFADTRKITASQRLACSCSARLPALARRDASVRIEIEEDVVPPFARQPIAKRDRLEIVPAGMTEENVGHRDGKPRILGSVRLNQFAMSGQQPIPFGGRSASSAAADRDRTIADCRIWAIEMS